MTRHPLSSLLTALFLLLGACSSEPVESTQTLDLATREPGPVAVRATPASAAIENPKKEDPSKALKATDPGAQALFRALTDEDDVRGGELRFELQAPPEVVAALLLDYQEADGNRSWAETFEVVEERADGVLATWNFRGRFGIRPSIDVDFTRRDTPRDIRIDFETVRKSFGISVYEGSYRVAESPRTSKASLVTMRVFLDSGLSFANASHEDIEAGLREDARRISRWLARSKAQGG